ncbi:MAG: hypothetical protein COA45_07855 [Zetaproteobacteria bacterium]|nr:MAG: hypothetical protein COA45_07855 [Zetaproteobacteria bacterium]
MSAQNLQERNKRVEADKAWETSRTRRALIALFTYLVVGFYLNLLNVNYAWLHALVPPMAYVLSTLSLPLVKKIWIEKIYNEKD